MSRALAPCAIHLRGSHLRRSVWLLICPPSSPARAHRAIAPFPFLVAGRARLPRPPAPLTCMAVTCVAHYPVVHPSPITIGRTANPAMVTRAHILWHLRSSPAEPRAPTSMAGVGGLARRRPESPTFPPYVTYIYVSYVSDVCCNYFILVLQH
jgi:hypothetical protein